MSESFAETLCGVFSSFWSAIAAAAPYWGMLAAAFALSLALTPLSRALSRRLGMVDQPGPRRINKTPIPRGGGIAVYFAFTAAFALYFLLPGERPSAPGLDAPDMGLLAGLSGALVAIGYADDKFGLPPLVKLGGQVAVAALSWWLADFSVLSGLCHLSPAQFGGAWWFHAADAAITVFWLCGAINAFNLIDGLDGLASGLAVIAAFGMSGVILFTNAPSGASIPYFALAGACLGFLRYNFYPASVFLGDSGSMFIGYCISGLPLVTRTGESLFVSLCVPMLVMGVPIFDTFLAILRRSVRALLHREENGSSDDSVMKADADHLHHRILRRFHGSQKAAARVLYGFALFLVAVAMGGIFLKDRAAALFIVAFIVALVVIVRDLLRVELWDTGRLLTDIAFSRRPRRMRLRATLDVPFSVLFDILCMSAAWFAANRLLHIPFGKAVFRGLPVFIMPVFLSSAVSGVYRIVWPRAQVTDFARLFVSVLLGTGFSAAIVIFSGRFVPHLVAVSFLFCGLSFFPMAGFRIFRSIARDAFFAVECMRLGSDSSAERILVYGAGLRFRAFRRELVRSFGRNRRVIAGIIDDAPVLRKRLVSGIPVLGTIAAAKKLVREHRIDSVVIAAQLPQRRLKAVLRLLSETGVKVSLWSCEETILSPGAAAEAEPAKETKR